jgi:lipopolysaccharide/colanic/teichoic acid biosynthesis glycosyltransferase
MKFNRNIIFEDIGNDFIYNHLKSNIDYNRILFVSVPAILALLIITIADISIYAVNDISVKSMLFSVNIIAAFVFGFINYKSKVDFEFKSILGLAFFTSLAKTLFLFDLIESFVYYNFEISFTISFIALYALKIALSNYLFSKGYRKENILVVVDADRMEQTKEILNIKWRADNYYELLCSDEISDDYLEMRQRIMRIKDRLNTDKVILFSDNIDYQIARYINTQFHDILKINDYSGLFQLWVLNRNNKKIINKFLKLIYRAAEICISLIALVLLVPLFIIISIMIILEDGGTVFYRQKRVGKNNKNFDIIKFRSMRIDAEQELDRILANEGAEQYRKYHKISKDPRVTKIGKFIRKYNIDELPQFYNVLKGDISICGPRAYMPSEIEQMLGYESIIFSVKPGMTGFWQVTDRAYSTFADRIYKDIFYVKNWSISLDLYIFVRTIYIILIGKGAG